MTLDRIYLMSEEIQRMVESTQELARLGQPTLDALNRQSMAVDAAVDALSMNIDLTGLAAPVERAGDELVRAAAGLCTDLNPLSTIGDQMAATVDVREINRTLGGLTDPLTSVQKELVAAAAAGLCADFDPLRGIREGRYEAFLGTLFSSHLQEVIADLTRSFEVAGAIVDAWLPNRFDAVLSAGRDLDLLTWRDRDSENLTSALWIDAARDFPTRGTVTIECEVLCWICGNSLYTPDERRHWMSTSQVRIEFRVFPLCPVCTEKAKDDPDYWLRHLPSPDTRDDPRWPVIRGQGEEGGDGSSPPNLRLVKPSEEDDE